MYIKELIVANSLRMLEDYNESIKYANLSLKIDPTFK